MDSSDPLDWEEWKGELPFWQHALCGSIAGVMEHISLFPLDTIKTRLQTNSNGEKGSPNNGCSSRSKSNRFNNVYTNGINRTNGVNVRVNTPSNLAYKSVRNTVSHVYESSMGSDANSGVNGDREVDGLNKPISRVSNRINSRLNMDSIGKIEEKLNINTNKLTNKIISNRNIATEAIVGPYTSNITNITDNLSEIANNTQSKAKSKSKYKIGKTINSSNTPNVKINSTSSVNMANVTTGTNLTNSGSSVVGNTIGSNATTSATVVAEAVPTTHVGVNRNITSKIIKHLKPMSTTKTGFYSNLFRGSNVIIAGCIPAHVLYFTVYEKIKSSGSIAASGAAATFCHDLILTPADVIKQRLQLGCYRSSRDCLYNVVKHEGVRALFRSFHITLLMNVPYHSLLVSIMHILKKMDNINNIKISESSTITTGGSGGKSNDTITKETGSTKGSSVGNGMVDSEIGVNIFNGTNEGLTGSTGGGTNSSRDMENYKHFVYAGIGGAVAGALTTPFDVIKTRLQTQGCQLDTKRPKFQVKYKNVMATFKNIYRREGLRGFTRGISTRIGMCTPSAAISWGTYESLKSLIKLMD